MTERSGESKEQVKLAKRYLDLLGHKACEMADIGRQTHYFPDRKENDAEHSYHLALTSVELAAEFYPTLDIGLVSQYSIVHDLVEVITGDIPSHTLNKKQREEKHEMERAALPALIEQLPPYTARLVQRYEDQIEPEARFVCLIDKLLPSVIHTIAPEANKEEFFRRYGIESEDHLAQLSSARSRQLREDYPEFDFIHVVRQLNSSVARKKILEIGNKITSDRSLGE